MQRTRGSSARIDRIGNHGNHKRFLAVIEGQGNDVEAEIHVHLKQPRVRIPRLYALQYPVTVIGYSLTRFQRRIFAYVKPQ